MATETLILRPITGSMGALAAIPYPEGIDASDRYTLISEEVADDDATYMIIPTTQINGTLIFSVPSNYKNLIPSAIRIVVRARADDTATTGMVISRFHMNLDASSFEDVELDSFTVTTEYVTYTTLVPVSTIEGVWTWMSTDETERQFMLNSTTSSGKNTALRVTQAYLEADFEVEDSSSGIFVKKNGVYLEASQIFQKINGSWTEITADEYKTILKNSIQT